MASAPIGPTGSSALAVFEHQATGIMNLIRAADVYGPHFLARLRGTEPDPDILEKLVSGRKMSGLLLLGMCYSKAEITQLREEGHLRQIGEQILVASYTALEGYLAHKFFEYLPLRPFPCC